MGALRWSDQHAVTVVVASHNYPGTPRTGDPITGLEDVEDVPTAYVMHAGTARGDDGTLVSAGGRVLSVVALGDSLSQARERVYKGVGPDRPRRARTTARTSRSRPSATSSTSAEP